MRRFAGTIREFEIPQTLLSEAAMWYDFDDLNTITLSGSQVEQINSKGVLSNMELVRRAGTNEIIVGNVRNKLNTLTASNLVALNSNKADYTFLHDLNLNYSVFLVFTTKRVDAFIDLISTSLLSTSNTGYFLYDESRFNLNFEKQGRLAVTKGVSGDASYSFTSFPNFSIDFNKLNIITNIKNNNTVTLKINDLSDSKSVNEGTTLNSSLRFALGNDSTTGKFQGELSECIIYNKTLTSLEENKIVQYLTNKWKLT